MRWFAIVCLLCGQRSHLDRDYLETMGFIGYVFAGSSISSWLSNILDRLRCYPSIPGPYLFSNESVDIYHRSSYDIVKISIVGVVSI